MNPRARQVFLAACERRMLTLFTHEPSGRRVFYRVGLGLQARAGCSGEDGAMDTKCPGHSLPWEGIRCKAQPDIEGIETVDHRLSLVT